MSGTVAELTFLALLGAELLLFTGVQIYVSFRHSTRTSGRFFLAASLAIYLTMVALMFANLRRMPDDAAIGGIALVSLIPASAWAVLALILHFCVMALRQRAPRAKG